MTAKTPPQQIVELLPGNPFLDFTGARPTSTIGVVIFAAFLGIAFLGVKQAAGARLRRSAELSMRYTRLLCAS